MPPVLRKRTRKEAKSSEKPSSASGSKSKKKQKSVAGGDKKTDKKKGIDKLPVYSLRPQRSNAYKKWPRQKKPIKNIAKVPNSWNWDANDPNLDRAWGANESRYSDIEGNIQRCLERIETGIMPQIFENRLRVYLNRQKANQDLMKATPDGVSFEVAQRLETLKKIQKDLEKDGDEDDQLSNVEAIIKAYSKQTLEWSDEGKVTYWFRGKQICKPRKWDIDDALAVSRAQNRNRGFWIEGTHGPTPEYNGLACTVFPVLFHRDSPRINGAAHHWVSFQYRIPGSSRHLDVLCMEDSGASNPTIYPLDIEHLEQTVHPPNLRAEIIGVWSSLGVGGEVNSMALILEARVVSTAGPLSDWARLVVLVNPSNDPMTLRLSGVWWRHMVYTLTQPDNLGRITVTDNGPEMRRAVADMDPRLAIPFARPISP